MNQLTFLKFLHLLQCEVIFVTTIHNISNTVGSFAVNLPRRLCDRKNKEYVSVLNLTDRNFSIFHYSNYFTCIRLG